ncbi:multidrug effflux MFS transporter [Pseudomonas sp. RP23018S]|uniref:multidrug effflux MFS transporter n=1 Tax=Pseudomonas sp. RP23018S TaxID=3096037 RepID=UPI002ACA0DF7|nr:multidrug effflux MFS transporter [Pseudomonas sp. RP23018S]MDZ5602838.1 multidrug effflux MFS transporter [Pseudomonas sp. RP23018S]
MTTPPTSRTIWLLAMLAASVPLAVDTYLPSLPQIAADLHADPASVQRTVGLFLLGLCSGMLIYGPLSDRYGRRGLLLSSLFLYIAASLGCAWVGDVQQLQALRFVQALGGAGAMVLARTIARDLFPLSEAARVLSLMHLIAMLATLVAPFMGTWLVLLGGWRAIFVALAGIGAVCLLLTVLRLPESLPRAARIASLGEAFGHYLSVFRHPLGLCYILAMGLSVGGMFCFITASAFVFIEHFGFTPRGYSLIFAVNLLAIVGATLLNAHWLPTRGPQVLLGWGSAVGAGAGVVLLVLGWGNWPAPLLLVATVAVFMGCSGMVGANCIARLMALFERNAGAAVGLAVSLQFACGALLSALVSQLLDGSPRMMCWLMGACGIGGWLCYRLIARLEQGRGAGSMLTN